MRELVFLIVDYPVGDKAPARSPRRAAENP